MLGLMLFAPAFLQAQGKVLTPDEVLTVTQPGGAGTQYQLNRTAQPPANAIILNITLQGGMCENVKFANATTGLVTIRNTSSPTGQPLKPDIQVGAGLTSVPHQFCCNGDAGQWLFEVGDGVGGAPDAVLTVNITCVGNAPSLTFYGLIALALLLAGTAVWMFRRRGISVA